MTDDEMKPADRLYATESGPRRSGATQVVSIVEKRSER
jgi:hypothetical protein